MIFGLVVGLTLVRVNVKLTGGMGVAVGGAGVGGTGVGIGPLVPKRCRISYVPVVLSCQITLTELVPEAPRGYWVVLPPNTNNGLKSVEGLYSRTTVRVPAVSGPLTH